MSQMTADQMRMRNGLTAEQVQTKQQYSHAVKGLFFGVISGATWGLDGVILGIALAMAPFTDGASLYAGALAGACMHDGLAGFWLCLLNIFTGKWREYVRTIKTKPGLIVMLAALFGGPIAMSGYLVGINLAGATYSLSITAMYPAVGAILAVFILKEKITVRVWIGILTCIAGAVIVGWVPPDSTAYPHFYLGLALSLLATFGWGMEGVLSTFGMDMVDPDIAIGIREATSFFVYLVVILPIAAGLAIFWDAFSGNVLMYMAIAGLAGGISYLMWYRALNTTGVGRAMALNVTYALWAIVFGYFMTDLELTANLVVGALVITFGTILVVANPKELFNLRENN